MHRFILHNDDIRDASEPCLTPGQVGLLAGWGVFSTIRVARGVLFAFERHLARMQRDAVNLRVPFPGDPGFIEERLMRLVKANGADEATLRVVVVRNKGGIWQGPVQRDFDLIALMSPINAWGDSVTLGVVEHGRYAASRFSGTKMLSWAFNLTWYEEAHVDGFDETILLNEHGNVSECTSANVFAAFGNEVRTPPLSSGCLPGVTRELLVSGEVPVAPFRVVERDLTLRDLEAADEVFITSTTRDLLPVAAIAGLTVKQTAGVCHKLRTGLRDYIERYVSAKAHAAA